MTAIWSPSVYGGASIRRQLTGMRRRRRSTRGRGVLDWLKGAAGKVGQTALDIGKTLAVDYAKKRLGLGRRRRRTHRGKGPIGATLGGLLGGLLGFGRRRRRGRGMLMGAARRHHRRLLPGVSRLRRLLA